MDIAIIGAGISGLSSAHILKDKHNVTIYESNAKPGGLIKCDIIEGNLFHKTGGHVFNTKFEDAANFFWSFFDKDNEFTKAFRNAAVAMENGKNLVGYPIENHVYQLGDLTLKSFINDILLIDKDKEYHPKNFEDFLLHRFGPTLYNLYFKPYNAKVWRRDLDEVPLTWLEGKLPMPTVAEMMYHNMSHAEERNFVHSSFFYPKNGGSQYIADTMAKTLNIIFNKQINKIERQESTWIIDGKSYDAVVFTGNIKGLPNLLNLSTEVTKPIDMLQYHGTTAVFCEIDKNPYSWIYQPSAQHSSHRIICTGNFSPNNNKTERLSATVEFTDEISKEEILHELSKMPFNPKYITHHYEKYTYPIQSSDTKEMIEKVKELLHPQNFYLVGRFAEWEYFNMDAAIHSAIKTLSNL